MPVKATNIVYALPYPALEAGNLSFPQGSYEPEVRMREDGHSIEIEHRISGAPFIERLIEEGVVNYYCLFSVPKTGIRTLYKTAKVDKVSWEKSVVGQPPRLRPLLIYTGEDRKCKLTAKCGVANLWQGKSITLPKGARLARGEFLDVNNSEYSFLRFAKGNGDEFKRGSFKVLPSNEDGFYFKIEAAPDVFDFVQKNGMDVALRAGILTGIVGQCFSILKYKYKETDEDSNDFPNLRTLSSKLESEYGSDWNDDDFDPMFAATTLYPLQVPSTVIDDDEDESV